MRALVRKMNAMFGRREDSEMKASQKLWRGSVGVANDIARSIRETEKFQVHGISWRNTFFFLVAIPVILFVLSYVN